MFCSGLMILIVVKCGGPITMIEDGTGGSRNSLEKMPENSWAREIKDLLQRTQRKLRSRSKNAQGKTSVSSYVLMGFLCALLRLPKS